MAKKKGSSGKSSGRGVGMPGMGGGGMGNIMAQVQKLQDEMAKTQEALGEEELTVTAGGGAVTIVVTGHREFRVDHDQAGSGGPGGCGNAPGHSGLAAVNDALAQVQQMEDERMGALTGGMGLPPGLI